MDRREFSSLRKKHDRFKWSQPYGYSFQEVDEVFESFQSKLAEIEEASTSMLHTKDSIIAQLKAENERLETEIVNLNIQLQSIVAPARPVEESVNILSDFMEQPAAVEEKPKPKVQVQKTSSKKPSIMPPQKKKQQPTQPVNPNNPYSGKGGFDSLPIIE